MEGSRAGVVFCFQLVCLVVHLCSIDSSSGCTKLMNADHLYVPVLFFLRLHRSREAKLFKGHIQLSTTKSGKYKKFGEDTIPFTDKPNWSEFDWVQDPNKPSQMVRAVEFCPICYVNIYRLVCSAFGFFDP